MLSSKISFPVQRLETVRLGRMRGLLIVLLAAASLALPGSGWAQPSGGPSGSMKGPPDLSTLTGPTNPDQSPTGELFEGYILVEAKGGGFRDPRRVTRTAQELARLPFENVLLQVRVNGEAYYNSTLAPKALGVAKDFDPLAEFLKHLKSGKNPKKVYAWLDLYKVANINRAVPLPPEHVTLRQPDWLNRNSNFEAVDPDGNVYLDPGNPQVARYLGRVAAEIVDKYDVDGIILDGARYPGLKADWGYNTATLDRWRREVDSQDRPLPKDEKFTKIRSNAINQTIRSIHGQVKQVSEDAQVGVFGSALGPPPSTLRQFLTANIGYHGAMQNWPWWVQRGWADFVLMRNYQNEGVRRTVFDGWNLFAAKIDQGGEVQVIPVIAGNDNISVDVVSQIRRVHQAGLAGVGLSHFNEPIRDRSSRELFFKALSKRVLAPNAERLSFPKAERKVVSARGSRPDVKPPPAQNATEEPPAPDLPSAAATDAEEPRKPRPVADDRPTKNRFISPSDRAITTLKRKFPNIF